MELENYKNQAERGENYVYVRDKKGYKVRRSRFIWEQHNGKIPEGFMIHHINGIKDDDRIENLMCVSRKEHGQLHRGKFYKYKKT